MTKQLTLRSWDIPTFARHAIGFDSLFNRMDELMNRGFQETNYPYYNILKTDENHFAIEVAVAGFKEGEVTVKVEDGRLTISGESENEVQTTGRSGYQDKEKYATQNIALGTTGPVMVADGNPVYLFRGISTRNFTRTFALAEFVEVINATQENGVLRIELEKKIPEEKKPKDILINHVS